MVNELRSVLDEDKFEKASVLVIQLINTILYGKPSPVNRYRQSVSKFTHLDPENVDNARNTLQNQDAITLQQISGIFNLEILDSNNAAHEIFQFLCDFGGTEVEHSPERTNLNASRESSTLEIPNYDNNMGHASAAREHNNVDNHATQLLLQMQSTWQQQQVEQQKIVMSLHQQVQQLTMQLSRTLPNTTENSSRLHGGGESNYQQTESNTLSSSISSPANMDIQKLISRQILGSELPKFDGANLEWPTFITEYNRSSKECGYTEAENMIRLRKSLTGKARACVEMMLYTSESSHVIEILRRNFGESELIIEQVIEKVNKLQLVTNSKSFLEFVNFLENLNVILMNFGRENAAYYNRTLVKQLISKLPDYLRLQCANYMTLKLIVYPTVEDLSKWATSQHESVKLFEIGSTFTSQKSSQRSEEKCVYSDVKVTKDPETFIAKHEAVNCKICRKGDHQIEKCPEFLKADAKQRWKLAQQTHACFSCLNRHHGQCKSKSSCGINGCSRFHHRMLHKPEMKDFAGGAVRKTLNSTVSKVESAVILKMIPVTIKGPKGQVEILAFLDEGSTVTIIDKSVTSLIGVDGPVSPLCCTWTDNISRSDDTSQLVSFEIVKSDSAKFRLDRVRTFQNLQLPKQDVDAEQLYKKYAYTKQAKLINEQPLLLIGQDNCDLIVSRESVQPDRESPMLTLTKLGWVVHGPAFGVNVKTDKSVSINVCCAETLDDLDTYVKKQMSLESFGVVVTSIDRQKSEDERKAVLIAETSIKKIDDRYEMALPYNNRNQCMEDSYTTAVRRLKCTERKIIKDNIAEGYSQTIQSYVDKNYAVKVSASDAELRRDNTWYLPHFPVINANKPGKIRLVFDAAAKSNGYSMNDYLLTGPDLVPSLFGILCRFRENAIAICADIVEMFPQVRIDENDSWSQCFLWRDLDLSRRPDVYKMNSMIFGATSSPFMAQFVKNYNAELYRETFPEATEAIVRQHYVDDFIESVESVEKASKLIQDVNYINQQAGYKLRGYVSNSHEALMNVPDNIRATKTLLNFDLEKSHRVLGVRWDTATDQFVFHYNFHQIAEDVVGGSKIPTKREVLCVAMSVFDPIGFISPLTITSRILLQHVWKIGIGWDDEISNTLAKKWFLWLKQLSTVNNVRVSRQFVPHRTATSKLQLHTFCDASESAYAAVIYLRAETNGQVDISFVASKARVSPIKAVTIPRLELLAAVLGVRLTQLVKKELRIQVPDEIYWSDSKTVLAWIQTKKRLADRFISTRVGEIVQETNVSKWNWVPTKLNPADKATRENFTGIITDREWLNGPEFLQEEPNKWPKGKIDPVNDNVFQNSIESEEIIMTMQPKINRRLQDFLPNPKSISTYRKLIKSTVFIHRICKGKMKGGGLTAISPEEIICAEHVWYKATQEDFTKEFLNGIKQYSPYLDPEGIQRVGGRLRKGRELEMNVKHPVILDGRHIFVKLLVQYYHEKSLHQGRETVLNNLRQKFYFPKMRAVVRAVINNCQECKVRRKLPQQPYMGNLPEIRLTPNLPVFTYVGIDFFGPMPIKIGRRQEKRWGVLFTCMVTRAVHIELTGSLSSDYTIMVLRRFQARRRVPKIIFCDNGTNFVGAATELKRAAAEIDYEKVQEDTEMDGVQWRFIPPASPHFGGCWERLIRGVKSALQAVLKEKVPREETLHTFLVEIENILNNRPITFVSTDPEDATALTPNMLLKGKQEIEIVPGRFEKRDEILRKQWRITQYWADLFWARWLREYIPQLLPRKKWIAKTDNLKVGDVVKIQENCQRGEWPLGRVTTVYPGDDGVVRVVDVSTKYGKIKRPACKLVPVVLAEGAEAVTCIDKMESIPEVRNVELR